MDPIFALLAAYNNDPHPSKVSLGVGVYKTNEAQNYTLPSVRQVRMRQGHGAHLPDLIAMCAALYWTTPSILGLRRSRSYQKG